jgi:hypothetical protein
MMDKTLQTKAALITVAIVLTSVVTSMAVYKLVAIFTITQIATFIAIVGCSFAVYAIYRLVLYYLKCNQS